MDEIVHWGHYDGGLLPETLASPWTKPATITTTIGETGWSVACNGATAYYTKIAFPSDGADGPVRIKDDLELQFKVQGVSADVPESIGFAIDDGSRIFGVSLGQTLAFVNADDFTQVIKELSTSFAWQASNIVHLIKRGSARWLLRVNGRDIGEIPYLLAPVSGTNRATFRFAQLPNGAPLQSVSIWTFLEASVNSPLPPQHKVERFVYDLPGPIRERWTAEGRAFDRVAVGLMERDIRDMDEVTRSLGCERLDVLRYTFDGQQLPSLEAPAWTLEDSGSISIVRERVRMVATLGTIPRARVDWPALATGLPDDVEYQAKARFLIRGTYTPSADDEVGPFLMIDNGDKNVCASLYELADGWAWQLGYQATIPGTFAWRVDPYQEHQVEVQVLGREYVILLVNGQIVDRVPYSEFQASIPAFADKTLVGASFSSDGTIEVWDGEATQKLSDLGMRPGLLQNAAERLIFVGGCERNDELRTWMDNHFGVQRLRGTEQGMTVELKRLVCSERVYLPNLDFDTQWVLDETFPDVSPIWLDLQGYLRNIFVEYAWNSPNFTLERLTSLIHCYLVPVSTLELKYYLCLITAATADVLAGIPVNIAVESSKGFLVDDTVTIRSFDNTAYEDVLVTAIPDSTHITVGAVVGNYLFAAPTPPIVRKVLTNTSLACGIMSGAMPTGTPYVPPPVSPTPVDVMAIPEIVGPDPLGSMYEYLTESGEMYLALKKWVTFSRVARAVGAADSEFGWTWTNRANLAASDEDTTTADAFYFAHGLVATDWAPGMFTAPLRTKLYYAPDVEPLTFVARLTAPAANSMRAGLIVHQNGANDRLVTLTIGENFGLNVQYTWCAGAGIGGPSTYAVAGASVTTTGVWLKIRILANKVYLYVSETNSATIPPAADWTWVITLSDLFTPGSSLRGGLAQWAFNAAGHVANVHHFSEYADIDPLIVSPSWGAQGYDDTATVQQVLADFDLGDTTLTTSVDWATHINRSLALVTNQRPDERSSPATVEYSVVLSNALGAVSAAFNAPGAVLIQGTGRYLNVWVRMTSDGTQPGSVRLPFTFPIVG